MLVIQILFRLLMVMPKQKIGLATELIKLNYDSQVTMRQIQMMIQIREFLPSTLHEKLRIKIVMMGIKLRAFIGKSAMDSYI
uniref:Uncharacterized protein n=1 Tax=Cyanothece sp. (strain PCC 7425 / ATCC 29141) TaxID=395961 RepID=B8HT93_CYAP4